MLEEESIKTVAIHFGISPIENDFEANRQLLSEKVNDLIQHDFSKLISILYRLDVNEKKLRLLLAENAAVDACRLIADLIIERQRQKIISRQQFRRRDDNIAEDDKW